MSYSPPVFVQLGSQSRVECVTLPFDTVIDEGERSRHHHFYFVDGTVVLRVGNTLFKIHRHFLATHSPVFEGLFTLNNPSPTEGIDDDHPIVLPGDDPVDFCRLLYIFYPNQPFITPQFTAEQWLSVLILSTKYDMETIRQPTIAKLQVVSPRLDPIRQIAIARQYNCPALVDEPIRTLTDRTQQLTLEEIQGLPSEDLHTIIECRESRISKPFCPHCPSSTFRCNGCRMTTSY